MSVKKSNVTKKTSVSNCFKTEWIKTFHKTKQISRDIN